MTFEKYTQCMPELLYHIRYISCGHFAFKQEKKPHFVASVATVTLKKQFDY